MFIKLKKKLHRGALIEQQIAVWAAWEMRKSKYGTYISAYERWIRDFVRRYEIQDICDVEDSDVQQFIKRVTHETHGRHQLDVAHKAVRSIRRFYRARGNNNSYQN